MAAPDASQRRATDSPHATDAAEPAEPGGGTTAPAPDVRTGSAGRSDSPSDAPSDGELAAPFLRRRRDGILPAVAAALSVRGETHTCTGSKTGRGTELHPLVRDFLDTLGPDQRARQAGRCPEAVLLSQVLSSAEASRSRKKRGRKPLSHGEAKRTLKHAKLTTRRIREHGDPLHGSFAPPCHSCAPLLEHFGVRTVAVPQEEAS
ncbi:YwqJ-related putative deaminase [Streptomyces oceani]|uniref:YwqJ-related putative deaminase n=1 Tax=Streptomyces oceani TaxID=1075402 RepID=UPI003B848A4A